MLESETAECICSHETAAEPRDYSLEREADGVILDWIAKWHVARQKALLRWAEMDLATRFGTKDDVATPDTPTDQIRLVEQLQDLIAEDKPATVSGARKEIEMALEILALRESNPEHVLARGPALTIIRNAIRALWWLDGRILLNAESLSLAD